MSIPREAFARAKVNLALHVTGKRQDGYHLLDSLVVFAEVGDYIRLTPAPEMSLTVTGPFAEGVPTDARNLIWRALQHVHPQRSFSIHLEKNLPHPAGLGGGSSDAAAALAALGHDLHAPENLAALGADLPVCLTPVPQRVQGIGERLTVMPDLPHMAMLLVNPKTDVPTGAVFKSLETTHNAPLAPMPSAPHFTQLIDWLAAQRNDLEAPALRIAPAIEDVLNAIRVTGAALTRMSGSGATCFGLYPTLTEAEHAAQKINHPAWWIKAAPVKTK